MKKSAEVLCKWQPVLKLLPEIFVRNTITIHHKRPIEKNT